jgi:hypothetical protein
LSPLVGGRTVIYQKTYPREGAAGGPAGRVLGLTLRRREACAHGSEAGSCPRHSKTPRCRGRRWPHVRRGATRCRISSARDRHDAAGARVPRLGDSDLIPARPRRSTAVSPAPSQPVWRPTRPGSRARVAHDYASRGLATAHHALVRDRVVETRHVVQRQQQQVYPDGTIPASWPPRI